MSNDDFRKRRLHQLVKQQLERTDIKALVQQVVREYMLANAAEDERAEQAQQARLAFLKNQRR